MSYYITVLRIIIVVRECSMMPRTPITPQTPKSVTITEGSTTSRSSVRLSARKHLEQALSNALAAAEPVANQNSCDLDQLHRYQQQLLEQHESLSCRI